MLQRYIGECRSTSTFDSHPAPPAFTDRIVRNGVIGRQLARLAEEAGFTVPTVTAVTSVFRDAGEADRVLGLRRNTERAVAAGYLAAEASQRWLDHLARGPFLAVVTLYVVVARK